MKSSSAFQHSASTNVLAGIGLMLAGIGLFAINDALGKWLLETYSVGELLLVRSAAALLLLAPFVRQAGIAAFTGAPRPALQVVRVVLSTLEVAMFFWAVSYLPLADTVTFYLGESDLCDRAFGHPARRKGRLASLDRGARWLCRSYAGNAAVGGKLHPAGADRAHRQRFLRPAYDRDAAVARNLEHRAGRGTDRRHFAVRGGARTIRMGHAVAARLRAAVAVWRLLDIALACVNLSLKLAAASVVVPYQYTIIVWAIVLGYVVFGDVADAFTLSGAVIIITAGLYIFWRQQMRGEQEPPPSLHP